MSDVVEAVETEAEPVAGVSPRFEVHLDEFEGPFDLLLSLIAKHRLEVTSLALHEVTDDFIAHIRGQGSTWDLNEATEFLVVAATLLDLKAARLLPSGEVEDEEDIALLEARDLLFARLLQYRAYKQVASIFASQFSAAAKRVPRTVGLDADQAALLPEVLLGLGPTEFALLAQRVMAPKELPQVGLTHLHAPRVSVREQAAILVERLRRQRVMTFRAMITDADTTLVVVARFLALLELFREGVVSFEQARALGELTVRWTGSDAGEVEVDDEFDEAVSETEQEEQA
jgi:segregation and condensation protein A